MERKLRRMELQSSNYETTIAALHQQITMVDTPNTPTHWCMHDGTDDIIGEGYAQCSDTSNGNIITGA